MLCTVVIVVSLPFFLPCDLARALHPVAMAIFKEFNVCDTLRISPNLLSTWVKVSATCFRARACAHTHAHTNTLVYRESVGVACL